MVKLVCQDISPKVLMGFHSNVFCLDYYWNIFQQKIENLLHMRLIDIRLNMDPILFDIFYFEKHQRSPHDTDIPISGDYLADTSNNDLIKASRYAKDKKYPEMLEIYKKLSDEGCYISDNNLAVYYTLVESNRELGIKYFELSIQRQSHCIPLANYGGLILKTKVDAYGVYLCMLAYKASYYSILEKYAIQIDLSMDKIKGLREVICEFLFSKKSIEKNYLKMAKVLASCGYDKRALRILKTYEENDEHLIDCYEGSIIMKNYELADIYHIRIMKMSPSPIKNINSLPVLDYFLVNNLHDRIGEYEEKLKKLDVDDKVVEWLGDYYYRYNLDLDKASNYYCEVSETTDAIRNKIDIIDYFQIIHKNFVENNKKDIEDMYKQFPYLHPDRKCCSDRLRFACILIKHSQCKDTSRKDWYFLRDRLVDIAKIGDIQGIIHACMLPLGPMKPIKSMGSLDYLAKNIIKEECLNYVSEIQDKMHIGQIIQVLLHNFYYEQAIIIQGYTYPRDLTQHQTSTGGDIDIGSEQAILLDVLFKNDAKLHLWMHGTLYNLVIMVESLEEIDTEILENEYMDCEESNNSLFTRKEVFEWYRDNIATFQKKLIELYDDIIL